MQTEQQFLSAQIPWKTRMWFTYADGWGTEWWRSCLKNNINFWCAETCNLTTIVGNTTRVPYTLTKTRQRIWSAAAYIGSTSASTLRCRYLIIIGCRFNDHTYGSQNDMLSCDRSHYVNSLASGIFEWKFWCVIFISYHGYAMREVSVNSTSLYETN